MSKISTTLRQLVYQRANYRCEYCQTDQKISGAQMHIEHIRPRSAGGQSTTNNLCLACAWCNSYKWASTTATDPQTETTVPLFNPRKHLWSAHFQWDETGIVIVGLTPAGRATIEALQMNNLYILPARRKWVEAGWHPPTN